MATLILKHKKLIYGVIVSFSIIAAIKTIFICLCVDEEYQITMGYRLLCGEKLIVDLWDPHQTSAFLVQFFMWIYRLMFHTFSGVVIWIRVCGTVIHFLASYAVYKVIKSALKSDYAFILSIIYFNLLPKNSVLPDYSIMMVWSLTFLLAHMYFLDCDNKWYHAVACGFWMCVMVLSYPSTMLLFLAVLAVFIRGKNDSFRNSSLFVITCLAVGFFYLFYIIRVVGSVRELIELLPNIVNGHSRHANLTLSIKIRSYFIEFGISILLCLFYCIVAKIVTFVICRAIGKRMPNSFFVLISIAIALVHHILHWSFMLWSYEYSYNYSFYILILLYAILSIRNSEEIIKRTVHIWIVFSLLALICVLTLTVLTVYDSFKYMIPGVVMGLGAVTRKIEEADEESSFDCSTILLIFICLTAIFVKTWQYQGNGGAMSNITEVRGVVKEGPAAGILTDYITSDKADSVFVEMKHYVSDGSSLFIVDETSLEYMYQDVIISSYSTICDGDYTNLLLKYWEDHPEKYPSIIAVSYRNGELNWDSNSWIINWIEDEYNASRVIDGKYYRYYFDY